MFFFVGGFLLGRAHPKHNQGFCLVYPYWGKLNNHLVLKMLRGMPGFISVFNKPSRDHRDGLGRWGMVNIPVADYVLEGFGGGRVAWESQ